MTILWSADRGIDIGPLTIRAYSLLFALGFVLGYQVMLRIFKKENVDIKVLDSLLTYMVIATIVGARLGHVFFYDWPYYKNHIGEIFMVWKGGLASHGAAIAIIIAMYFFSKKVLKGKQNMLWILDRVVITVALAGAFIRLGNYFNSEIYGTVANSSIETVFARPGFDVLENHFHFSNFEIESTGASKEIDGLHCPVYSVTCQYPSNANPQGIINSYQSLAYNIFSTRKDDDRNFLVDNEPQIEIDETTHTAKLQVYGLPRTPTQLIEALGYLLIFIILFNTFKNPRLAHANGFHFGMFLVLVFGFRFVIEFWKANQVDFESGMSLNMGQWLSIPLVLAGLYFILRSRKHQTNQE